MVPLLIPHQLLLVPPHHCYEFHDQVTHFLLRIPVAYHHRYHPYWAQPYEPYSLYAIQVVVSSNEPFFVTQSFEMDLQYYDHHPSMGSLYHLLTNDNSKRLREFYNFVA
eukprot:628834_1